MGKKETKAKGRPLGQHFLFDRGVLEHISDAAELQGEDNVLEVGPGLGTLTRVLSEHAGRVVAVELDEGLRERFAERTQGCGNVELVNADILKVDLNDLWLTRFGGKPFKVVANLPYYITTPIIMRFMESGLPVASLTVMVQKEVADRLASKPGSRDYGAISVAVQYRASVRRAFIVPAGAFSPPPRVDSAVLAITLLGKPAVEVKDEAMFFTVVRGCFSQRRKTLRNNLSALLNVPGDEAAQIIQSVDLNPQARAETLGLDQFAALADRLTVSGRRVQ